MTTSSLDSGVCLCHGPQPLLVRGNGIQARAYLEHPHIIRTDVAYRYEVRLRSVRFYLLIILQGHSFQLTTGAWPPSVDE